MYVIDEFLCVAYFNSLSIGLKFLCFFVFFVCFFFFFFFFFFVFFFFLFCFFFTFNYYSYEHEIHCTCALKITMCVQYVQEKRSQCLPYDHRY